MAFSSYVLSSRMLWHTPAGVMPCGVKAAGRAPPQSSTTATSHVATVGFHPEMDA